QHARSVIAVFAISASYGSAPLRTLRRFFPPKRTMIGDARDTWCRVQSGGPQSAPERVAAVRARGCARRDLTSTRWARDEARARLGDRPDDEHHAEQPADEQEEEEREHDQLG